MGRPARSDLLPFFSARVDGAVRSDLCLFRSPSNVAPSLFFRVMNMWFLPRAYVLLLLLSINNRAFSIERKARKDSSPFQASCSVHDDAGPQ